MLRLYMLFNSRRIGFIFQSSFSTQRKEKWDLFTSVYLERKPIISQSLNSLEVEFNKYLTQVELERSLLSDHEIRHEKDKKHAVLLKSADSDNLDLDVAAAQTAQDFEDACNEELTKFKFSSRESDGDKKNFTSIERKLDKHLVLLTEQKIGTSTFFLLPQSMIKEKETLKQCAQRVLESCGNNLRAQIYGNAPAGFYKYKYPQHLQKQGVLGAKVFIYFARFVKGDVNVQSKYKWLDQNEIQKEIPKEYYESIRKFNINDSVQPVK